MVSFSVPYEHGMHMHMCMLVRAGVTKKKR
jgi:hypothetical protein